MTVPSKVVSLDGDLATVESFGVQRTVSIVLMSETVAIGDYVAIMANAYAVDRIPSDEAIESLAYLREVLDASADDEAP